MSLKELPSLPHPGTGLGASPALTGLTCMRAGDANPSLKWHRLSRLATFPVLSLVSKTIIRALQIGTWRRLAFLVALPHNALPLANLKGQGGHEDQDP